MYHRFFGLDEQAFSIAVDPRYLYMSTQHREALAHLLYGVSSGGFVMLSGEVGTGKTTIIRCLLEQLPDNADLAVVLNPSASARDLLCSICDEFGVAYAADETSLKVLTDKLTEFLVANHKKGKKSIVLIDEAQLLRISTLEQVRLLTNLETNTQKLLQIVLVGQPELNELLAKPALRQLSQRITARYHLRPLSEKETDAYIKHRLKIAGLPAGRSPFPAKIVRKIHQISHGIPRVINVLCDRMLLGAFSREASQVDFPIARQAAIEVLGELPETPKAKPPVWVYAGAGLAACFGVAVILALVLMGGGEENTRQDTPQVVGVNAQSTAPSHPDSTSDILPRTQDRAVAELLIALNIKYDSAMYPCWVIAQQGYECKKMEAASWDEFRNINRPAVLTVVTPSKHKAYATVLALSAGDALLSIDGDVKRMSLDRLGPMWTGEYMFVWSPPPGFEEAVGVGSAGPVVRWVAEKFAELDGQPAPLTRERFNSQLEKRVKLFQKSQNLQADGFVGLQTLLKLNEVLGIEKNMSDLEQSMVAVDDGGI